MVLIDVVVVACVRTQPIYNLSWRRWSQREVCAIGAADVHSAIIEALKDKGWVVGQDDPVRILAELLEREIEQHLSQV